MKEKRLNWSFNKKTTEENEDSTTVASSAIDSSGDNLADSKVEPKGKSRAVVESEGGKKVIRFGNNKSKESKKKEPKKKEPKSKLDKPKPTKSRFTKPVRKKPVQEESVTDESVEDKQTEEQSTEVESIKQVTKPEPKQKPKSKPKQKKSGFSLGGSKKKKSPKQKVTDESGVARSKPKNPKRKKIIIIVSIVLGVLLLVGAGVFGYFYIKNDREEVAAQLEGALSAQQEIIDTVINNIKEVLVSTEGYAKVYDSSHNYLFTLRDENAIESVKGIPSWFITEMENVLLGSQPYRKCVHEDWVELKSIWGKLTSDLTMEYCLSSSLGAQVAEVYAEYVGASLSNDAILLLAMVLDEQYTETELVNYCIFVGHYGRVRGIAPACEQWFNNSVDQLTENQLRYFLYAYENTDATWTDFSASYPQYTGGATSADRFGFVANGGTAYFVLRSYVMDELLSIIGDQLSDYEFDVELSIDATLQEDIQRQLDNSLSTEVSLNANGSTVVDGVVAVIDPQDGTVKALVGGRSVNAVTHELYLPYQSMIGSYQMAKNVMASDPVETYISLEVYKTEKGFQDYATIKELTESNNLVALGLDVTIQDYITLGELIDFSSGLYFENAPRFIKQITIGLQEVYAASKFQDVSAQSANVNIRSMLADSTTAKYAYFEQQVASGISFMQLCDKYIVCGIVGSDKIGYVAGSSVFTLLRNTIQSILNVVPETFKEEPSVIDSSGILTTVLALARERNANIISYLTDTWCEDLLTRTIDSVESRNEWESFYEECKGNIDRYRNAIEPNMYDELLARLEVARKQRTEELLAYLA